MMLLRSLGGEGHCYLIYVISDSLIKVARPFRRIHIYIYITMKLARQVGM